MHSPSRDAIHASELCCWTCPLETEGTGNAGSWPPPWPACNKKCRRQVPQVQPRHPGIPRAMVLRIIRDLPGERAFLPPSPAQRKSVLASLAPASRRQDHTTSPSAAACTRLAQAAASIAARLHVRDDAYAPLARRDADRQPRILKKRNKNIFCEPSGQTSSA